MHKEYILLNGFRKAKRGFTAGFHVPLMAKLLTLSWSIELKVVVEYDIRELKI